MWPCATSYHVSLACGLCMCVHAYNHVCVYGMRVCVCVCVTVLHRRLDSRMRQLCTCDPQGKMYWESKSVGVGGGSHASIFLNSRDPLEYSPPICSSIQTDVWAGIVRKKRITPSYLEYNIGWKSNSLPEGCLGYAGSLRHMKEKYCVHYVRLFISFIFRSPAPVQTLLS